MKGVLPKYKFKAGDHVDYDSEIGPNWDIIDGVVGFVYSQGLMSVRTKEGAWYDCDGKYLKPHVPDEVIQKARAIVAEQDTQNFPEDDWRGIGDEWDLNLYVDDDGKNCATLYKVKNGSTNTAIGYPVTNLSDNGNKEIA